MQEFITKNENETEEIGENIGKVLPAGSVLAMYGELGSGKTALVRGIARGMGINSRVQSPTFTIVNEYEGKRTLYHFDMYRLSDASELFDIGWEDYLNAGAVCAVEWSENVQDAFFGDEITVRFTKLSETERRIEVEGLKL
ncbi:MAG: tRNA (adenosine(37)-N6)-threonylcarbamoyltransferase complex ATPase subunit type 1 TsaE [Ruminococcaceae bacterium]|nr:tRNA (adenosine(37)-N6)-threonylcarbamoyltransferase complex ATPase subunit type 1 TsaE [Oscillospiraceae bacterium]